MKDYFSDLYTYNLWGSKKILHSLIENQINLEKTTYWMSHIINAETIWLDRILEGKTTTGVHTLYPLEECEQRLEIENERYLSFLEVVEQDFFQKIISYQNSKGALYSSKVVDILAHVINHSTHHRAHISVKIRESGFTPPATDYIFFTRS
ncbi:MAG: DinB family protein [Bacteroidota bacterium]